MKKNVHEITIKIEGQDWTNAIDKAFKKKNKEVRIDGFRKGTAPKDVYIKKFGIESLYMDAVDSAVSIAYDKIINEQKLVPVIEPKLDVKNISEEAVEFAFTIITKPEVKLGDYTKLGVKKETAKITKKEISEEIEHLRQQLAEIVVKEDGKVENGDTAVIDFKGTVDGKALEGGNGENYPLEIGSKTFIPGFEEGLVGLAVGETKTLNLTFPEDYVADLKGKDVVFEVTVREIKTRKLPEINEDFFKDLGYDEMKTVEELEAEVEKTLKDKKQATIDDEYAEKCLEKAASNMKIDLNEEIIDDEIHHMIHQFEQKLSQQGLTIEQYYQFTGQTHEKMHEQMEEEAKKRVTYRYLLEAVVDAEKIDFSEKEVKAKAKEMADNYGISVDELLKAYGNIDIIKYDMTMHKAIEIIKES
ncbi:MAG: trigger factor [Bacilli bacterium]|nr:trigger factor [Bacilli bacterium]